MIELMTHQKEGLEKISKHNRYGFFWDTGTGKTILGLSIINVLFKQKKIQKPLIVCPLTLISGAWIDDYKKNNWNFDILNLHDSEDIEKDIITKKNTLFVINYETFRIKINQFKKIDCIIYDESSKLKNRESKIAKTTIMINDNIKYCYLFSGTPAPNTPLEYYTQLRCINALYYQSSVKESLKYPYFLTKYFKKVFKILIISKKQLLLLYNLISEKSFYPVDYDYFIKYFNYNERKNHYFITYNNFCSLQKLINEDIKKYFFEPQYNDEWILKDEKSFKIFLDKYSWTLKKEECLDLPEKIFQNIYLEMTPKQRKIYNKIKDEVEIILNDDKVSIACKLTEYLKLRQITSGFLIMNEHIEDISDVKLNALVDLCETIERQVIIVCNYKYEIEMIKNKLLDNVILEGGMKEKDFNENRLKFKNNEVKYLICNIKTVQFGHTFTNCSYMIFFSLTDSYENYYQIIDRIMRYGQKNNCNYYRLIMNNSIDEHLLKILDKKEKLQL